MYLNPTKMKNLSNENILTKYMVKYIMANSCHSFSNEIEEKEIRNQHL